MIVPDLQHHLEVFHQGVEEILRGTASLEDVRLIKEAAPGCRIKAAGGIRNAEQALAFIQAGAHRVGTSAGVTIMQEFRAGTAETNSGSLS